MKSLLVDGPRRLVAVVVLYRTPADESATLLSLCDAFSADPSLAAAMEVTVWDNTPSQRFSPTGFAGKFWHDPSNPGLARAYNSAYEYASERGADWLVTLDQDTHITAGYLREMLDVTLVADTAAVVPRLACRARTVSPFRPRSQGPPLMLEDDLQGETKEYLQAFNSGTAWSIPFLKRIGGFDLRFPLDYLDHAMFARLHRDGAGMLVMSSVLEHELSSQQPGPLSPGAMARERSVLAAERRFIRIWGTPEEQRMYPVRMLRRAASVLIHRRDRALALLIFRTMVGGNQ